MEASRVLETFLPFHQTARGHAGEDRDNDNEELSKLQKLPALYLLNPTSDSNCTIEGITNGNMIDVCKSSSGLVMVW
jgi:hypothetical protein